MYSEPDYVLVASKVSLEFGDVLANSLRLSLHNQCANPHQESRSALVLSPIIRYHRQPIKDLLLKCAHVVFFFINCCVEHYYVNLKDNGKLQF